MYKVDRETFKRLVTSAVEDMPDTFRDRITNLQFVVEDMASSDDYARLGVERGKTLLGVYRGIPLCPRCHGGPRPRGVQPDRLGERTAKGTPDIHVT